MLSGRNKKKWHLVETNALLGTMYMYISASTWEKGTCRIGDQQRLREACTYEAASSEPLLFTDIIIVETLKKLKAKMLVCSPNRGLHISILWTTNRKTIRSLFCVPAHICIQCSHRKMNTYGAELIGHLLIKILVFWKAAKPIFILEMNLSHMQIHYLIISQS